MTNIRKEAFIKEYRSVYLEDPNFENINDLDLYSWWQWACDWQKAQDIDAVMGEYLGDPTKLADDIAYDNAITDAINAIRSSNG